MTSAARAHAAPAAVAAGTLLALAVTIGACAGHGLYLREEARPCLGCAARTDELDWRVVLIGDTGEIHADNGNPKLLEQLGSLAPERTTILFLGDNVYPAGFPAPEELGVDRERGEAEAILTSWLAPVEASGAEAVFLPGNHDWRKSKAGGMARVRAQAGWLAGHAADPMRVRMLPVDACPGPLGLDRGRHLRLILADSEWLLTDRERGTDCSWGTEGALRKLGEGNEAFYAALGDLAAGGGDRRVVYAAHHPLLTNGPHGGYFTAREFVFPFTVWKSWLYLPLPILYPVVRYGIVKSPQDLVSDEYRAMQAGVSSALEAAGRPVVTAGGHEHVLQVFEERDGDVHLVSGSGSHSDIVGTTPETQFRHGARGLMVLDAFVDGRVLLRVLEPRTGAPPVEVYGSWLGER